LNIRLKKIELEDKEKILSLFDEYEKSEPLPNIDKYEGIRFMEELKNKDYTEWLKDLKNDENQENLPEDFSAHIVYLALDENDEIVGVIDNRLKEVPILLKFGGFIGYSVRPSKRGNGYAALMLKLSLEKMWDLGKNRVLISCKDFNIASKKTIEKNGGKYIDTYYNENDNCNHLRYCIDKENI
jgi:predicted acetyltransferase